MASEPRLTVVLGGSRADMEGFLRTQVSRGAVGHARTATGALEVPWGDDRFLETVKALKRKEITSETGKKAAAMHALHFFLSGNCPSQPSIGMINSFIQSWEWYGEDVGGSIHFVSEAMTKWECPVDSSYSPPATTPTLADMQAAFDSRMSLSNMTGPSYSLAGSGEQTQSQTTAPTIYQEARLSDMGIVDIPKEEAFDLIRKYHDLIEVFFNSDSRAQPTETFYEATCFMRSLYVLTLIIFRCSSKDPDTVSDYIKTSYLQLARNLVACHGSTFFSLNPLSIGLVGLMRSIPTSSCNSRPTITLILALYSGLRESIQVKIEVQADRSKPDSLPNPLAFDSNNILDPVANLLEGGCLLQIRYKGLPLIRAVEELSRMCQKSVLEVISLLASNITVSACLKIASVCSYYSESWVTVDSVITYNSPQMSWRYSKNLSDNVLMDFAAKVNTQLIYRFMSILALKTNVEISRIRSIQGYRPDESDRAYIQDRACKLFGSQMHEVPVQLIPGVSFGAPSQGTSETPAVD